jgi:CBS domain-containing protein
MQTTAAIARGVITIDVAGTIGDAARSMESHGVGALVVVDGERLAGIVTDRDLVVRGLARRLPDDARVDAVMTTDVVALDGHEDVQAVLQIFRRHDVRRVPIVDGHRPIGMVTADDVLVDLVHDLATVAQPITNQVVLRRREPALPVPVHEPGLPIPVR